MPTIKGFSTRDMDKALKDMAKAGVKIKMPFSVNTEFDVEKDPFPIGLEVDDCDGKKLKIKKKTKEEIRNKVRALVAEEKTPVINNL